jgi:tRNA nucleotidyltransferase (CCA-adding enzyme)
LFHAIALKDGASEGQVRLDEDGENVILDAMRVLNSKYIHLSSVQQEGEDDSVSDSADRVRNVIARARNKAMAEVSHLSYLFLYLS